jgi:hypothetical protein
MNRKSCSTTPLNSKSGLNSSKSLFHDFVRPRGQFASKHANSPFKCSPQPGNFDFIPLSYSSPINNMNRGGSGGNWGRKNRKSFVDSHGSSSCNSSFSPVCMNRRQFRNSPSSSNDNSGFSPCNNMGIPRKYSSNRRRRVGIHKKKIH